MDIGDPPREGQYEAGSPEDAVSDLGEYHYEPPNEWSSAVDDHQAGYGEAPPSHETPEETPLSPAFVVPVAAAATATTVIPKIAEKGKGPYFCDLCNKTFTNYGSYRRHLRMHYCEKKYTCHLCGRQFFRRYLWVKHQEKIHGNDPSSCRCPHCGDWSQSPNALREHLRTQHKRTNGCKENWTKEQGSPCKSPISTGVANTAPAKKPRKKRAPKVDGTVKEKRRKKTAAIVIKEEILSDPPAMVTSLLEETSPDKEPGEEGQHEDEKKDDEYNVGSDSFLNSGDPDDESGREASKKDTSRYGRKRKQRVLFNTETYPSSLKRFRRTSLSSPGGRRKSIDSNNSNGLADDHDSQPPLNDDKATPEEKDISEEPVVESELSKLLQQALPNTASASTSNLPKNVSHRGNFFCDKCRRFFINRSSYMRHKKMHTGVKPFTCEYCCLSFFRSESLTNHKKKHAKEDFADFRCHLCGYKAANCASLRNHFHTVCSREKTETDWPPGEFQDGQEATNGEEEGKNTSRNIAGYCSLCNRAFFNLGNYQRHAKLHSAMASSVPMALTYNCSFCGKVFTNRAQYDGHVLAHSKEEKANENAGSDNGVPTSLQVLKLFGNFVNEPTDGEVSVKEEPLDEELNGIAYNGQEGNSAGEGDGSPRVMCCRLCPLAFTDRKTFLQHQKSHRRSESPYSCYCRYCGHPHKNKSEVSIHESLCYEARKAEERLHHCYNCEVKFDNGSALREHVKAAHSNDRLELARRDSTESLNSDLAEDAPRADSLKFVKPDDKNSGKYKCGKCNETFSEIQSVVSHIQKGHAEAREHEDQRKSWEPTVENGTSIMKQLLSSPPVSLASYLANTASPANATPSKNSQRSFSCSLCLKAFDDPRVAEAHEQQAHVMVDWFQCALCEKTGGKKVMLSHMASHMIKIGSVVTTLGDQDPDSDGDTLDLGKVPFPDRTYVNRKLNRAKPRGRLSNGQVPPPASPQFVSMFCQLCKKVISSLATLERHRHASQDPDVAFPYICCMPGCGKCFALKVEAVAHLQTLHKGALNPSTPSAQSPKPQDSQKNRWLLGNSWKGLVAGGVGPFSQSLVQLSMAAAGNDPEAARNGVSGKREESVIDIYQADALENLASNGELTITKVGDVEEITVEPLLDCVLEQDGEATEDKRDKEGEDDMVMACSPRMVPEDLEEGEIPEGESPPLPKDFRVNNKVLLQCEDCQSVFTNPCSWKRHRKLHLGIMKHKCSFCNRLFYRKDHCDKHVKTHENNNNNSNSVPRRRKSPINIKVEAAAAL